MYNIICKMSDQVLYHGPDLIMLAIFNTYTKDKCNISSKSFFPQFIFTPELCLHHKLGSKIKSTLTFPTPSRFSKSTIDLLPHTIPLQNVFKNGSLIHLSHAEMIRTVKSLEV